MSSVVTRDVSSPGEVFRVQCSDIRVESVFQVDRRGSKELA